MPYPVAASRGKNFGSPVPWWAAGGLGSHCLEAHQPVGAASYAESLVNLVTPGTYDAVKSNLDPTWDTVNGWAATGNSTRLISPNLPLSGIHRTIICKFFVGSNSINNIAVCGTGVANNNTDFGIRANIGNAAGFWHFGAGSQSLTWPLTVIASITYNRFYCNGVFQAGRTDVLDNTTGIGIFNCTYNSVSGVGLGASVQIRMTAIAIYDIEMSDSQITTIANGMSF